MNPRQVSISRVCKPPQLSGAKQMMRWVTSCILTHNWTVFHRHASFLRKAPSKQGLQTGQLQHATNPIATANDQPPNPITTTLDSNSLPSSNRDVPTIEKQLQPVDFLFSLPTNHPPPARKHGLRPLSVLPARAWPHRLPRLQLLPSSLDRRPPPLLPRHRGPQPPSSAAPPAPSRLGRLRRPGDGMERRQRLGRPYCCW